MSYWYSTGTLSVANGATTVTGTLTGWNPTVRAGDFLFIGDNTAVEVGAVADNVTLTLARPWPFATVTNGSYAIAQGLLWATSQGSRKRSRTRSPRHRSSQASVFRRIALVRIQRISGRMLRTLLQDRGIVGCRNFSCWPPGPGRGHEYHDVHDQPHDRHRNDVVHGRGGPRASNWHAHAQRPAARTTWKARLLPIRARRFRSRWIVLSDQGRSPRGTSLRLVTRETQAPQPGYNATSTSSVAIGTGSKAFSIGTGYAFAAGQRARAARGHLQLH